MLIIQMSELLAALDKPAPLATPPPTSNHLNLHFHFEQRHPTKRRSLSLGDFVSRDGSNPLSMTGSASGDVVPSAFGCTTLPRGRSSHLRRPSTAPGLVQSPVNTKRRGSSDRPLLEWSTGPTAPVSRSSGRTNPYTAAPQPAGPSTAPSSDWRLKDQPPSRLGGFASRSPSQEAVPRILSPASAALSLSDSSADMHPVAHSMDQSAQHRRSVAPLTIAELSSIPSASRPPHARRMSSLSLGGGVHHIASLGSSMDFGKFMPQTSTTSPRAASFGNVMGKGSSPVDVKRLLTKPATPVGTHSPNNLARTDDTSGNVLLSPTAPQSASDDPSAARSGEMRARQPFQHDSKQQSLRPRARPNTAATHAGSTRPTSDLPRRPATASAGSMAARGAGHAPARDDPSPHTYSSGGEGIGESPQPKRSLKRSSSSRPANGHVRRTSAYVKTDGYLSESSVRLPRVTTALTPAAAIALAYRSTSVAGHREERVLDPKVAPWESDPDLPIHQPAPSEWGDLCTPSGFRRLGRKISMKMSGDEGQMPARAEARARTRSFDRPKPRDLPRKPSFDTKRPPLPYPTTPSLPRTSDSKSRPRTPDVKPHSKPSPSPVPAEAEPKRRTFFGTQLLKKLSNPNLRSKPSQQSPGAPPVPPLPSPVLREKALLDTPLHKSGKGLALPPVPAIPIHLTRSAGSEPGGGDESAAHSAASSTDSFAVAFPSAQSTPGSTPPRSQGPKKPTGKPDHREKQELPYTIDIERAPFDRLEPPLRNPMRAKRKPSEKELREGAAKRPGPEPARERERERKPEPERDRKPDPPLVALKSEQAKEKRSVQEKKSEPVPRSKSDSPQENQPEPTSSGSAAESALSEDEQAARKRLVSRSKRDKASKLSISISDPRDPTLHGVSLQRSPSYNALTPRAAASASAVSPGGKTRTHSDGDVPLSASAAALATPLSSRKSPYSLAQAFPPPRSASLTTMSSPSTPASRPSASPQSAQSSQSAASPPAVAFRTIRSGSNKAPLTERQKTELWDELLRRSDEAGGTLLLRAAEDAASTAAPANTNNITSSGFWRRR
ncbi:hypothetical protein CALCODRAFT_165635 [Calocera cornea HHB12733]|uniref:Uncharacterized protein n=1 Tax=Calocera cornea HHB12733 TaxID=1353952 RepID=A0A165HWC8_9BASI|nr:hypothetical protein CALCODRAFT_165635 [Calocera cornea HHB12733]